MRAMFDRVTDALRLKAARRPGPGGPPFRLAPAGDVGRPVWTPRDYQALAREGYAKNPVVHRCVRLISEAAAFVPWVATVEGREVDDHPLLRLLARPNPRAAGPELVETVIGHLLIAGNAYVEVIVQEGEPRELHALRPDRVRVVPGADGWPVAYDYTVGSETTRVAVGAEGPARVLHLKQFNPTHDHYGLAPLEAAATALDVLNAAARWHKALLDNSARPSGALVYAPASGAALSREQYERLKQELEESFAGPGNAGRPLLLEGGLDWRNLSLSPRDLDFVAARDTAARDVALAFGVPPMLLGIPGDATYANYQEANRAFWRQTVLPLVGRLASGFEAWLGPAYGGVKLGPDLDAIDALHPEREALWRRVGAADFLDEDEKRAAVGYGPRGAAAGGGG